MATKPPKKIPMQFVACIGEEHELYDHSDPLGGMVLGDGGLYFFVDWGAGILASIFRELEEGVYLSPQ